MKEKQIITIGEVKEFATDLVEKCKWKMMKDGFLSRLAYLFVAGQAKTEDHADTGLKMVLLESPKDAECGIFVLDLDANDDQLVSMIAETEPKFRKLLSEIERLAASCGTPREARSHHIVQAWMNMTGMRDHAIVTAYMRAMVKHLEPYAVVMQADTWTIEPPAGIDPMEWRKKCHENLADEPTAKEAISISLETKSYRQLTNVVYNRQPRKTGKVISFEEPKILASDSPSVAELGGQVFGALRDFPMN